MWRAAVAAAWIVAGVSPGPPSKLKLRKNFIKLISTEELAQKMAEGGQPVLDVRTAAEFDEPAGRQTRGPGAPVALPKTPIVTYCSVGYRSARFAQRCKSRIYRCRNLEGSIFNGQMKV
jgi:rhodanese-related sulfurtransferase